MLWFVIACILLIAAIIMVVIGKKDVDSYKTVDFRKWALIPLGLGAVLILMSSMYTQDPGEAVVIRSFTGKVVNNDITPGMGFTAPWNSTISFDIRNQRIEMFGTGKGDDKPLGKDGARINAPLQGSSNAFVSITVRYSIKPGSVQRIYELHKTQENLLDNVLKPGLRDEVRVATAKFPPFQVKERRAELTADIQKRLEERWSNIGVVVDDIDLGDLTLDDKTEEALRNVNKAQADVEEARAKLDKAYIEAETTKTDAQAQADADQIIRCGATTTTETRDIAGKKEQVTIITPKMGSECENRLNQQVLISKYLDTLEALGDKGNMMIVIPNSSDGGANGPIVQLPQPPASNE